MTSRKRNKKKFLLEKADESSNEFTPSLDGLPIFERYIVIKNSSNSQIQSDMRIWFDTPKKDEIKELGNSCLNLGYTDPIYPYSKNLGFSESFSKDITRLIIKLYYGKSNCRSVVTKTLQALKKLLLFLSNNYKENLFSLSVHGLVLNDFLLFRDYLENLEDISDARGGVFFRSVKAFFIDLLKDNIGDVKYRKHRSDKEIKPAFEHTSPLFIDHTYSESVMFQLLAQFIYGFERRISFIHEYEDLTEDDLNVLSDGKWLHPNDELTFSNMKGIGAGDGKHTSDQGELLRKWLKDEKFYPIIDMHILIWHKYYGENFWKKKLIYLNSKRSLNTNKYVRQFRGWQVKKYGVLINPNLGNNFTPKVNPVEHSDINKITANIQNQIGYCLVNIIMIATGLNKEVPLSWLSEYEGASILEREDTQFYRKNGESSPDIVVSGLKNRQGKRKLAKKIDTIIPKSSPIYNMLKEYESIVKSNNKERFFEFTKSFNDGWSNLRFYCSISEKNINGFPLLYPVLLEDGTLLQSLETGKFRKVFAKNKLFDLMDGVNDANELADKLREAMSHGNLDTTLAHYILKAGDARSAIDIMIAMVTSGKLKELRFQGVVDTKGTKKGKKDVFRLCECEDPSNPTHGYSIAEECKRYDLCLGCKRSIISKKNLPYICYRILQYEDMRQSDSSVWSAFWEDRWMIANDALNVYKERDLENGESLIKNAWDVARNSDVMLPPIIMGDM